MGMEKTARLWEVKRPFDTKMGNYHSLESHVHAWSWAKIEADFSGKYHIDEFNWVVGWEWFSGQDAEDARGEILETQKLKGEPVAGNDDLFVMHLIHQRHAELFSISVDVCRNDEPAVRSFLEKRWDYMRRMWAPLS